MLGHHGADEAFRRAQTTVAAAAVLAFLLTAAQTIPVLALGAQGPAAPPASTTVNGCTPAHSYMDRSSNLPGTDRLWGAGPRQVRRSTGLGCTSANSTKNLASGNALSPAWSTVSSPHLTGPNGILFSVSCPSSSFCAAVGAYLTKAGQFATLAEVWNGSAWAVTATPGFAASTHAELDSVSCTAATSCIAAGFGGNSAAGLIESWNGTAWSLLTGATPAPNTSNTLDAITCLSTTACEAVGDSFNSITSVDSPLAETWNGTAWTIQATPNPTGATSSQLYGVACSSASACEAVGEWSGSTDVTLAEGWDGTAWSLQATPNPSGSTFSFLAGVACSSGSACEAVGGWFGTSSEASIAEGWDGTAWTLQATPGTGGLNGVSCPSAAYCTAVGFGPTVETWNGTSWTTVSAASPPGAPSFTLIGVVCASASACTAVGGSIYGRGYDKTLAESWNGTAWSIQATPNVTGILPTWFAGISCTSSTVCEAVGGNSALRSVAEGWNGTAWSVQATPKPSGSLSSQLHGVSCWSPTGCEAVGVYAKPKTNATLTLAMGWNGTSWTIQSTPNPTGATHASLSGVSCPAAGVCTAVGGYSTGTSGGTVAESWNGTAWTIQATPSGGGTLSAISCTSSAACTAVGSLGASTLAEAWNGTAWSIQASPNPTGATRSQLQGVSCPSAGACTAVGTYWVSTTSFTMAEAWNGTAWSLETTPNPTGATYSSLQALSCSSASACTAVGFSGISTLAEAWNGALWSIQATPSLSPGASSLSAVSCTGPTFCFAVGQYSKYFPFSYVPLIERYS
jgi:hypothetical protein